jgi:hypothetical protein
MPFASIGVAQGPLRGTPRWDQFGWTQIGEKTASSYYRNKYSRSPCKMLGDYRLHKSIPTFNR